MIWVYGGILLVLLIGIFLSRNIDENEYCGEDKCGEEDQLLRSKYLTVFVRCSILLCAVVDVLKQRYPGAGGKKNPVKENLRILFPDDTEKYVRRYRIKKMLYILLIVAAGTLLCMILSLQEVLREPQRITTLARNAYGEGSATYALVAEIGDEETGGFIEEMEIALEARKYTEDEVERYIEDAKKSLETLILGENPDAMHVMYPLQLVVEIPGSPVHIRWETDQYECLDTKGRITAISIPAEGIVVNLLAVLSLEDTREMVEFAVRLMPQELTYEQQLVEQLSKEIQRRNEAGIQSEEITLPEELYAGEERVEISFSAKPENVASVLFLLSIVMAVAIYLGQDKDLRGKVESRNREMGRQYPEFISKLVLLLGAGLTIRGAFQRIAEKYEKRRSKQKKAVYEEVSRINHEIDTGVSEGKAYASLGKRCEDVHYVRLSMLLTQNLMKGSSGLSALLSREAQEAFMERKRNARAMGEEASTKLLGPMMLMLIIVMVMIMVPAFFSFGGA